ncbi:MAG TPA: hypothetical protein VGN18_07455 [Jatrophihabitans sp.]|jgi:hypothetical protein|uniref:hypothetical protein n=1 Tax=Jatrophihabitans sp. TaxID=1932789 RepID=UPI002E0A91C4|nr:hypothetical protein [Jatrophihabitans sp.]
MSEPVTAAGWSHPAPLPPPPAPAAPRFAGPRTDHVAATVLAGVLVVLGALLGLVWAAWSPPGPRALVISPGVFVPDETESFIAGDGRFLVIAAVVGLLAGIVAWRRVADRGLLVMLGLAVGGTLGAVLMALVGHLTGGGTFHGGANTIIDQLPLSLHMHGLLFVEPAVATLLYGMCVAFTVHDDLGRPDPVRDRVRPPLPVSVGGGAHAQDGGRYGDAAGLPQQRDLPPQ